MGAAQTAQTRRENEPMQRHHNAQQLQQQQPTENPSIKCHFQLHVYYYCSTIDLMTPY